MDGYSESTLRLAVSGPSFVFTVIVFVLVLGMCGLLAGQHLHGVIQRVHVLVQGRRMVVVRLVDGGWPGDYSSFRSTDS